MQQKSRMPHLTAERAVLLAWAAVLVLFSGGAFRIDEPNIMAIAEQIAREPLDPYGFYINWTGTPRHAFEILANPPLLPAWLALWASAFGWSEVSLHLSVLPFSMAALLAVRRLAVIFDVDRMVALTFMLASPAFVLGSLVVMPDVAMLSFFLWALVFLLESNGSRWWAMGGAVVTAMTPLVKYNGLILLPLIAIIGVTMPRTRRRAVLYIVSSVAALALWEWFTVATYARSHFFTIAEFENHMNLMLLTGALAAIGLAIVPLPLLAFEQRLPLRRSVYRLVIAIAFIGAALVAYGQFGYLVVPALLFGCAIAIASHVLITCGARLADAIRSFDAGTLVLVAWVFGTIAFQFRLIFTSVRYMLPLLVPVLFLLARGQRLSRRLNVATAAAMLFTLSVAVGDTVVAGTYRSFARSIRERVASSSRLIFDGHWGFQYYMERLGGTIIDGKKQPDYAVGDLVVIARNPFPSVAEPRLPATLSAEHERVWLTPAWPIRTVECRNAANFYGNGIGPCVFWGTSYLPFSFSMHPSERFDIYAIRKAVEGEKARRRTTQHDPEEFRGAFR